MSELRDVTCHMGSHSVTCHPTQVNAPRLTPAMQAGNRFTYPRGMEGWVDLVDLIAPRPGVEPATFRSRVRRRTAAPPRQPSVRVSIRPLLFRNGKSNLVCRFYIISNKNLNKYGHCIYGVKIFRDTGATWCIEMYSETAESDQFCMLSGMILSGAVLLLAISTLWMSAADARLAVQIPWVRASWRELELCMGVYFQFEWECRRIYYGLKIPVCYQISHYSCILIFNMCRK